MHSATLLHTSHSPYRASVVAFDSLSAENQRFWPNSPTEVADDAASVNGASNERFIADQEEFNCSRASESPQTPASVIPSALYSYSDTSSTEAARPRPRINFRTPVVIPTGAFHVYLATKIEFIEPPRIAPMDHPAPNFPCYRLFLGQVRFETTGAEVRWIIRHLTGVTAVKVEPRGCGCFLAYFRTRDEMLHVKSLHKRLLFDHTGVWYARTEAQVEMLHRYVDEYLAHIGRGFRLPKDTIVVEEEKISYRSTRHQHMGGYSVAHAPYHPNGPGGHPLSPLNDSKTSSSGFGSPSMPPAATPRTPMAGHSLDDEFFGF